MHIVLPTHRGEESAERRARTTKQIEPDVAGISSWLIGRERGICPSALQIWSQRILPYLVCPSQPPRIQAAVERETHAGYQFSSSGHLSRRRRDDLALLPSSPARRGACVLFSLRFRASFIISWIGCHGLMVLHHHDIRLCVVLSILSEHKIWDLFDLVGFGSHIHF